MRRPPRPKGLPRKISDLWWAALKYPASDLAYPKRSMFWVWRRWRDSFGRHVRHKVLGQVSMFDDVNVDLIPKWAKAVAGYVGGNWPTFSKLPKLFPNAKLVSIAVASNEDAEALDIERGDAVIEDAPAWFKRQVARGVKRPIFYIQLSEAQALINYLSHSGIRRSEYRLITAHYSYKRHLCSPKCGLGFRGSADATQWTDKALGRSLDETLCSKHFFA